MGTDRLMTKETILALDDIETEDVYVPEWGGTVRVRGMSGIEREQFEKQVAKTNRKGQTEYDLVNFRAKYVAMTLVDEQGKRLFSDSDAQMLGRKSFKAIERLFDVARRLSGLTTKDEEEMTENFSSEDGESSSST